MAESQENAPTSGEHEDSQQTSKTEGPAAKTFTQDEVDAIVKRRLDRLNGKHATDTDALERRIAELEARNEEATKEANALKAARNSPTGSPRRPPRRASLHLFSVVPRLTRSWSTPRPSRPQSVSRQASATKENQST